MAETSFINKIAIHATANTAVPTLAAKGANIATWTGFSEIGSAQRGDDGDLDEDSVAIGFLAENGEVRPPRSLTREDLLLFANGVDSFTFVVYDGSEALLALDSDIAQASNVSEKSGTRAKRTVIIEVNGLWIDYFPNCVVQVSQIAGSFVGDKKAVSKTTFTVYPCATTNQKGGWERHHYQAA
jgi:hypothetical protein